MNRFGYGTRIDGYEVIDNETGRPVGSRLYHDIRSANGAAQRLNAALKVSPRALAAALGADDRPLPHEFVGGRNILQATGKG